VDEQHRLTRPHDLILEFDAVDLGVFHDDSSVLAGPLLRWANVCLLGAGTAGGHACGGVGCRFGVSPQVAEQDAERRVTGSWRAAARKNRRARAPSPLAKVSCRAAAWRAATDMPRAYAGLVLQRASPKTSRPVGKSRTRS
jgi:hypothetical protein